MKEECRWGLYSGLCAAAAVLGVATAATVTMAQDHKPNVILPLMVPYLAWVAFATALNAELLRENPEVGRLSMCSIL